MPPSPSAFYESIDATGVVVSPSVSTLALPPITDGAHRFGTVYLGPGYESYAVSLTGADAALIRADHIQGNNAATLNLIDEVNGVNHKLQTSYSFTVQAVSGADVQTLSVTCAVTATVIPIMNNASMSVANGSQGKIGTFGADEPCTFAFDPSGSSDNSAFTLSGTNNADLNLTARSAFKEKPSYTIKLIATSIYKNSLHSVSKTYTVSVTDGNPLFLQTSGGALQSGSYSFNLADNTTTLLGANNDALMWVSDACLFSLSGTDASLFSVAPTVGGVYGKSATLTILAAARHQDKPSYSLNLVANNGTHSLTNAIVVTVGADAINPILTGSAANSTTYTVATGVNSTSNRDTISLNSPWSASSDFCTVLADESVTFSLSGADSALFQLDNQVNVTSDPTRPNSRKTDVSFKSNVTKYIDTTYNFAVVATDTNSHVTTKYLSVVVHDVTKPIITQSVITDFISNNGHNYTNAPIVQINYSTDENLSAAFAQGNFTLSGASATLTSSNMTVNSASLFIHIDTSIQDQDITLTLNGGQVKDAHNNNILNDQQSFTFRYSNNLSALYTLALIGAGSITIPQGQLYTDAGYSCNAEGAGVSQSVNTVNPAVLGTYAVTYTVTVGKDVYTATRNVTVSNSVAGYRPKPTVSLVGGTSSFNQIVPKVGSGAWTDDAQIVSIYNSVGSQISVVSTNNVDTSKAGQYTVTYTPGTDDVYGALVVFTRQVTVIHPAQVITYSPIPPATQVKTAWQQNETFVITAQANPIYDANGKLIPITVTSSINTANYPSTGWIRFNGTDGATQLTQVQINLTVGDMPNGIDFTLGGLSQNFTLNSLLQLNAVTGAAAEPDYGNLPGMNIQVSSADWNNIFYLKPSDPHLELMVSNLVEIEIFEESTISYKINAANMVNIADMNTLYITENVVQRTSNSGNVNEPGAANQIISNIVIRNAVFDMFGLEFFENVFSTASKNAMISEVNNIFKQSGSFNSSIQATLLANNSKDNTDVSLLNLVRQLVLQLHKGIAPSGLAGAHANRLTGQTDGMFHSSKKVSSGPYSGYYPFLFSPGDTLQFSATLRHTTRNTYMTNSPIQQPRDVSFLFKLIMT